MDHLSVDGGVQGDESHEVPKEDVRVIHHWCNGEQIAPGFYILLHY